MKTITYDETKWKLVPIEPTERMIVSGFESEPEECFTPTGDWEQYEAMTGCQQAAHRAKLCWGAMLASAPTPPADGQSSTQDHEDAERYRYLRSRDDASAGVGCWLEADGAPTDYGWLYGDQLDRAIDAARKEQS